MSLGLKDLKKKSAHSKKPTSAASKTARPWDASGLVPGKSSKKRPETEGTVMTNEWATSHTTYLHDFETFAEAKIEQAQEVVAKVEAKIKRATSGPLKILGFALRAVQNQK